MTVNAIAGTTRAAASAVVQRKPEAAEVNVGGDHDGDADDRSIGRGIVNASGQKLGQLVNVKA